MTHAAETGGFWYACHLNLGQDLSVSVPILEHSCIPSQKVACMRLKYHLQFIPFQHTFDYNTHSDNNGRLGEFIVYIALATSYLFFGARNFHSRHIQGGPKKTVPVLILRQLQ